MGAFPVELARWLAGRLNRIRALRRLRRPGDARDHGLPGDLIVSVTSHPPRFGTLHLSLGCLLDQSVRPDRVLLWIAREDVDRLPESVTSLKDRGLQIAICDEMGPFKKLVPALEQYPEAYVVTADDDLYYPRRWLETLTEASDGCTIVCHIAHRPRLDRDGRFAPYAEWRKNVQDQAARRPSPDIMPTSGSGVLFPPGSLDPIVTERSRFLALCPTGDDLWYHWTARLNGTPARKVGGKMRAVSWPRSQASSLWSLNRRGTNDEMIQALGKALPLGPVAAGAALTSTRPDQSERPGSRSGRKIRAG